MSAASQFVYLKQGEMNTMDLKELAAAAAAARERAYAPYSGLRVGAALRTRSGRVITGVNVENVSFGATCCAERTALFRAVAEGEREFDAIAVASDLPDPILPCGICRQVLAEFRVEVVIAADKNGNYKEYRAEELLPHAFISY